jgi:hypothetical protein
MKTEKKYGVIIETDEYAGNFEREITAWTTGQVGDEDDTGIELARQIPNVALIFEDSIGQESDDHGCYRPCEILDEGKANSVLIHFITKPTAEQVDIIRERAKTFKEEGLLKFDRIYSDPTFSARAKQPTIISVYVVEKVPSTFNKIDL